VSCRTVGFRGFVGGAGKGPRSSVHRHPADDARTACGAWLPTGRGVSTSLRAPKKGDASASLFLEPPVGFEPTTPALQERIGAFGRGVSDPDFRIIPGISGDCDHVWVTTFAHGCGQNVGKTVLAGVLGVVMYQDIPDETASGHL
jgi:hypothetical protein